MKLYTANIFDFPKKDLEEAFGFMSEERKKAVLLRRDFDDKKRTIIGELLARNGISEVFGVDKREIRFARDENGKPFCENLPIHFNISHSFEKVVCVLSEKPLGVDVEKIRHMDLRLTKIACTEKDKEFIFENPNDEEQKERFFKVWTAKEAYLKFTGEGITKLKSVNYEDLIPFLKVFIENEYIITVYEE